MSSLRYCLAQMSIEVLGNAVNILDTVYEHVMNPFKSAVIQSNHIVYSPSEVSITSWNQSECAHSLFQQKLLKPMPKYDDKMFTFSNRLYMGSDVAP